VKAGVRNVVALLAPARVDHHRDLAQRRVEVQCHRVDVVAQPAGVPGDVPDPLLEDLGPDAEPLVVGAAGAEEQADAGREVLRPDRAGLGSRRGTNRCWRGPDGRDTVRSVERSPCHQSAAFSRTNQRRAWARTTSSVR
jgi:hypothetical protein